MPDTDIFEGNGADLSDNGGAAENISADTSQQSQVVDAPTEYANNGGAGGDDNYSVEKVKEDLRQIESLAELNPSIRETPEYKDLVAKLNNNEASQEAEENEDENLQLENEELEDEDSSFELSDDDDIFGITKSTKPKEVELGFEVQQEMTDFISSKFGVDDPSKFFASVDTWRTQAQHGVESEKQLDALHNDLQSMPPDLTRAVTLWANGDDYSSAFSGAGRLDFSEDFVSQDIENLVQHYLPEQYNKLVDALENESISEDEFEDKVMLLSASTERHFKTDKQALEKERADFIERQKNESKLIRESANSSVENLSKTFPNFSKSELNKVRSILVEGRVEELFINNDGTYAENAAELIANALYGSKLRGMIETIAKRQGESDANMKTVDSSRKTVKKSKSTQQPSTKEAEDAISHLNPILGGGDVYE